MIRGTTPTLEFVIPFSVDQIAELFVSMAQNNKVVIDKDFDECELSGNKITVRLSQDDTLNFDDSINTEIQVRIRTIDGNALASKIIVVDTGRILKDGVI